MSASPVLERPGGLSVLKFGGTSVGSVEAIARVRQIVGARREPTVLVFSAAGHTTDHLVAISRAAEAGRAGDAEAQIDAVEQEHQDLARALLDGELLHRCEDSLRTLLTSLRRLVGGVAVLEDLSPAVTARLLSFGELLSTRLLAAVLAQDDLPVTWVDARDVVVTEDRPPAAEPLQRATDEAARRVLLPLLEAGHIPLTQGFLGRSPRCVDTTLGRGGSDLSATLLGAALGAAEVEIWTDVDGVMTADPSLVDDARSIPVMSFAEAAELAFYGARVLHPRTLVPAVERGIPVRVKNTRRPEVAGTVIVAEAPSGDRAVKSIAYKEEMVVLHLSSPRMFQSHSFLERVCGVLHRHHLHPHAIATSEVAVAVAVLSGPTLGAAEEELAALGTLSVRRDQAYVCLVGEPLRRTPGIVCRVFEDLADVETSLVSLGSSEIQMGFVVDGGRLAEVVRRLHRRFFEDKETEKPVDQEAGLRSRRTA